MTVRLYQEEDWQDVWSILEPVFRAGETYAYDPDISEEEARRIWTKAPHSTYVVELEKEVLGTYYLKANQPYLGAHVCNCGYVVATAARGRGVASQMCEHSQNEARSAGFTHMQYNLVASSNVRAIALWEKHGFHKVGVLSEAFNHTKLGKIDALVMYKSL